MNRAERDAKIEEYGRGFELFAAVLAKVPREAWEFKPAPREWSVHEIVVHMADSESMGALRARKLIVEPGSTLMAYEDGTWADKLGYRTQSMEDALEIFRLARQTTFGLLKTLSEPVFAHVVAHPQAGYPEYGNLYTLDKWLLIYTHHVQDHTEQLKKALNAWKEQNK